MTQGGNVGPGDTWKIGLSELRWGDGMKFLIAKGMVGYRQEGDLKLFIENHILSSARGKFSK